MVKFPFSDIMLHDERHLFNNKIDSLLFYDFLPEHERFFCQSTGLSPFRLYGLVFTAGCSYDYKQVETPVVAFNLFTGSM